MVINVDVLVIGTGTAGYTLSLALRKAGRKVAVVDMRVADAGSILNEY
jgi:pyruvate/2-oxoglutarate dehydrogenase complex dihydrolipoamide dehydrogenase (E3) component